MLSSRETRFAAMNCSQKLAELHRRAGRGRAAFLDGDDAFAQRAFGFGARAANRLADRDACARRACVVTPQGLAANRILGRDLEGELENYNTLRTEIGKRLQIVRAERRQSELRRAAPELQRDVAILKMHAREVAEGRCVVGAKTRDRLRHTLEVAEIALAEASRAS